MTKKRLTALLLAIFMMSATMSAGCFGLNNKPSRTDTLLLFTDEESGLYGFMDVDCNIVIPAKFPYSVTRSFTGEYAIVLDPVSYRMGQINKQGEWVIDPAYPGVINPISDGLIRYEDPISYKIGYMNMKGYWAIEPQFVVAYDFSQGMAVVRDKELGRYGIIDTSGRWIVEPKYRLLQEFHEGLAYAREGKGDLAGYINTGGNWVIQPQFYPNASNMEHMFAEGLAAAVVDLGNDVYKKGYIRKDGSWAFTLENSENLYCGAFSEGLARVQNGTTGKYGFINTKGDWVIPAKFGRAEAFSGGLAVAADDVVGLKRYINKNGEWEIEPQFDVAFAFEKGFALVRLIGDDVYATIDTKGNVLRPK